MDREWSTSLVPEPLARSSTSRKSRMVGKISRQRCLIRLHTSCPSGQAWERKRWKHGDGSTPGRCANSSSNSPVAKLHKAPPTVAEPAQL
eukprot:592434-Prymnesium_polylepis.1